IKVLLKITYIPGALRGTFLAAQAFAQTKIEIMAGVSLL
ncbi:unnamed protein product, partial [marine sediment metagenome]